MILKEVEKSDIEKDCDFKKIRTKVHYALQNLHYFCKKHIKKLSNIPQAKIVEIREYSKLAFNHCKQCQNLKKEGNIEYPVAKFLSKLSK